MVLPTSDVNRIAKLLNELEFDSTGLEGQQPDTDLIKWYFDRFDLFVKDNCKGAIQPYLRKLQTEHCNQLTKLIIMHDALARQKGADAMHVCAKLLSIVICTGIMLTATALIIPAYAKVTEYKLLN